MSDATARGEFGHVGRGLTSSAKPFVPTLGDGEKPSLTSTSSAVYAAPFVPSSSASQTSQRLSATSRRGADGESQNVGMVLARTVANHARLHTTLQIPYIHKSEAQCTS